MKKVLISGAGGFLGSHLWSSLSGRFHLIGADLPAVGPRDGGEWIALERPEDLAEAIQRNRPDAIVHAAFVNRKPREWSDRSYLDGVLAVNLPLFETCAKLRVSTLVVSSSAVYGNPPGQDCFDESAPRRPVSLYGVAKALQEMLAEYQAAADLKLMIVRLFNLAGPGQQAGMLLPDWVSQVKGISQGAEPILEVRHQSTSRDFVDVRDAAEAIVRLIEDFRSGEVVNVASGHSVSLREIRAFLQTLCSVPFKVRESHPLPAGADIAHQRGNADKLRREWGWERRFDWKQSIRDLWDAMETAGD